MHIPACLALGVILLAAGACTTTAPEFAWTHAAPSPPAAAEAPPTGGAPASEEQRGGPAGAPTGSPGEKHMVSFFVGGTVDRAGGGLTLGADYEYRLKDHLGVGAFGEYVAGDFDVGVLGGGVFFHPREEWVVLVGLGAEFGDGESEFLARVGGSYEIPLGTITLSPTAYVDFVADGELAYVFGLKFGKKF